ncbi:MAG: alpha/beta hydrolase [Geminicoccaceae bacterium]|nr:alpha/beta hydrolase [Geminicoccaceae bacterium]
MTQHGSTTILLVHGSWHGGWAFDEIAARLRAEGHVAHAPCLAGLGSDAVNLRPEFGMLHHVSQLQRLVEQCDWQDFVLVGHSYGGTLVHALETRIRDRLRAVVHLEGAITGAGQSVKDSWPEERRRDTLARVHSEGEGWRVPPPDAHIWQGLSEEQIAWLQPKLTSQAMATYTDRMPDDAGGFAGPHYYLYADDRVPQPYQYVIDRFSGDPLWHVGATRGGHELMFSNPDAVMVAILAAIEGKPLPATI